MGTEEREPFSVKLIVDERRFLDRARAVIGRDRSARTFGPGPALTLSAFVRNAALLVAKEILGEGDPDEWERNVIACRSKPAQPPAGYVPADRKRRGQPSDALPGQLPLVLAQHCKGCGTDIDKPGKRSSVDPASCCACYVDDATERAQVEEPQLEQLEQLEREPWVHPAERVPRSSAPKPSKKSPAKKSPAKKSPAKPSKKSPAKPSKKSPAKPSKSTIRRAGRPSKYITPEPAQTTRVRTRLPHGF